MTHIRHWLAIALGATIHRSHPGYAGCSGCGRSRIRQDTGHEAWCSLCSGTATLPALVVFPRELRGLTWAEYVLVAAGHGVTVGAS